MRRAVFVVVLYLLAAPVAAQRLPDTVIPEHYTLWFAPDLSKATFRGRETIRVQVKSPTTAMTLHAAEIAFVDAVVEGGGASQAARVTLDEKAETATLHVARQVPAGAATIRITYNGILNDKLRGFYLSKANGRSYAVTQMEATDGRRAFPSFDEPLYKATFEVSLMIDQGDSAISNGAQVSDTPGPEPGKHTVVFAPTPKMSTYLVAMIVGDFVCRSGAADGTPIRICSTPDKLPLTQFALEAAEQQLAFFNDYFGIKYPFGKLDIIAVPDFAAGAMENVGAITFRERLLLVEPQRASLNARKGVASVLSHEIAHQWFGNLVTMKWWNDIWLNEGFATWIASRPMAAWRPEWRVELDDAADTQSALGLDALRSTRAIRIAVETPEQINEVFDGIAYEKTAGVLRMIESLTGREAFRRGISSYLKKYAYGNAAGEDFWAEMARVTGQPIDRILQSYVEQPGVPVLSVASKCNGTTDSVALSQERFVERPEPAASRQAWTVPVCFASAGQPRCELLDRPMQTFTVNGCSNVFANAGARGYYFTEYTPAAVRAFSANVAALEPVERVSLLGDEWNMVRAGRHDIGVYLDLAASLADDDTAAITNALASRIGYTTEYLVSPAQRPRVEEWIRARFGPALTALGVPGGMADSDERQSRRAQLLDLVARDGADKAMQARARELAVTYIADPSSLSGTLAPTILRVAATSGDTTLYDRYMAQIKALGEKPEEYYRFFGALPLFSDPALVQRTLTFALSPEVRTQDTGQLIGGLLGQPSSRDAAWTFVKAQWPALTQKLGTFQGIPGIVGALGNFCSSASASEIRQFFAKNPVPSAERTVRQAIERIEGCAAFVNRQSGALSTWMANSR